MKTHLFFLFLLLSLWACKSNSTKEEAPVQSTVPAGIADSLHGPMDTSVHAAPIVEKKVQEISTPHITDRICNPNFTLLAKPQKNRQIFYVTGFNYQEFK